MKYERKKIIELGKNAFDLTIYNDGEELADLAKEAGIALGTLKTYRSQYVARVIEPKPTEEELKMYEVYKQSCDEKRSQIFLDKKQEEIKRLEEAFDAFLETITNSSAIIDLALKNKVNPEDIRTDAFKYAKKYAQGEKLELFKVINENRSESFQKDKIDFSIIEELLNCNSNKVIDYLNLIINKKISPESIIIKIDMYLKYKPKFENTIRKLTLIKKHVEANKDYVKNKIKTNNLNKYRVYDTSITKDKTIKILTKYCLDSSLSIDNLLYEIELNAKTFASLLLKLKDGTAKEKLLYNEYQKHLDEECRKVSAQIKVIYNYLENGIEKQGQIGSFNALDYWRFINEKPDVFLKKVRHSLKREYITRIEFTKIENFINNMQMNNPICSEEELLSLHCAYNGECLDNEDEKQKLIDHLKEQDMPLYQNVYYASVEEYVRGQLVLNSEKLNKL